VDGEVRSTQSTFAASRVPKGSGQALLIYGIPRTVCPEDVDFYRPLTRQTSGAFLRGSLIRRINPGDLPLGHHDVQCADAS
jgi:hypothetical protein